ncbi:tetratricopeptide repeat protein [Leptolyngbya sp. 7M]|uniref:tetratricopeptide repeat protein n=1 Tax=Leptolyngbya sp. 7M TaxID=2812896 RepID=UPI001B8D5B38|nr:tetratricopeptide repeat protein [Leptolyngbya sp. 7M]QYO65106.1 tetratricopeptide repeat protein [Leptolyngbya sp. 7M]
MAAASFGAGGAGASSWTGAGAASQYRRAITCFNQALQLDSQFAEAYYNRGRASANLRRITDAVADLVKASELYLEQGNTTPIAQLKQDLEQLKPQK